MLTRAQLITESQNRRRAETRLFGALPSHNTFDIDPHLILSQVPAQVQQEGPDLSGLCYAFFEGRLRGGRCHLLRVSNTPEGLTTQRWREDHEWILKRGAGGTTRDSSYLQPAVTAALSVCFDRLGRTDDAQRHLLDLLCGFRIERGVKSHSIAGPRRCLPWEQATAAEALGLCLAHLIDASAVPFITAYRYP